MRSGTWCSTAQPSCAQQRDHQRGAARAVHVVVAEYAHRLAVLHRIGEAVGGDIHVDQHGRIGQQRPQRGIEEVGTPPRCRCRARRAGGRRSPAGPSAGRCRARPGPRRCATPSAARSGCGRRRAHACRSRINTLRRLTFSYRTQVLVLKLWCASTNRTVPDLLRITIEWVIAPCAEALHAAQHRCPR